MRIQKLEPLAWIALFFGFSAFLFQNQLEGLGLFDASEYSTHFLAGGFGHPPGYPLYLLLGKVMLLWVKSPFFAQHLISNASFALSVALVIAALRAEALASNQTFSKPAVLATAVFLYSSFYLKLYTVLPEVFLLNIAIHAGLALAITRWYFSNDDRTLFWVFACYGLGLSHHHTLALTIPAFTCLWFLRAHRPAIARSLGYGFAGLLLGCLPLAYLVWPLPENTLYTYYFIANAQDFLFVLLRRAYGTLSLVRPVAGGREATGTELIELAILGLTKNLNRINYWIFIPGLFAAVTFLKRNSSWKQCLEPLLTRPLLVFSFVSLFCFFLLFLPNANIDLTSRISVETVLRFFTIPAFLLSYPAYHSLRYLLSSPRLVRPESRWIAAAIPVALLLVSNFSGCSDLDHKINLLEPHIREAYRIIGNEVPAEQSSGIGSNRKCVVYAGSDSLLYGVRYFNQFQAEAKCFIFSKASFSGHFRARNEEALQSLVLGEDHVQKMTQQRLSDTDALRIFFGELLNGGYRVFLLHPSDYGPFSGSGLGIRLLGNIQELVIPSRPRQERALNQSWREYLKNLEVMVQNLEESGSRQDLMEPKAQGAYFQNLFGYPLFSHLKAGTELESTEGHELLNQGARLLGRAEIVIPGISAESRHFRAFVPHL